MTEHSVRLVHLDHVTVFLPIFRQLDVTVCWPSAPSQMFPSEAMCFHSDVSIMHMEQMAVMFWETLVPKELHGRFYNDLNVTEERIMASGDKG